MKTDELDQESRYSPEEVKRRRDAENIRELEESGAAPQKEDEKGLPLVDQESSSPSWKNKYFHKTAPGNLKAFMSALKGRKGAVGGVAGVVIIALMGISTLAPSMLIVHVKEIFVTNHNYSESTLEMRANTNMVRRLASSATSGSCNVVKVACRFQRMPDNLLRNMDAAGFTPVDIEGRPLNLESGRTTGQRAAGLRVTLDNGSTDIIRATELRAALRNNPTLRSNFRNVYNPRFAGFADSAFQNVMSRLAISKHNQLANKTPDEMRQTVDDITNNRANQGIDTRTPTGDTDEARATADSVDRAASETRSDFNNLAEGGRAEATDRLNSISGKLVGGIGSTIVGLYCGASEFGKILSTIGRGIQIVQTAKYAMLFLTVADAIKSGDASPQQAEFIGRLLTDVTTDIANNVRRAAIDSSLMKYGMFGDAPSANARPRSGGASASWKDFVPGAGMVKDIEVIRNTLGMTNDSIDGLCSFVNTPEGGLLLDAVDGPAGIIIGQIGQVAIQAAMPLIEPLIYKFAASLVGNITAGIYGEDVGDAVSAGILGILSATAVGKTGSLLSKPAAARMVKSHGEYILAYAEEQRVTRSPLDITSPYTAMGSLVTQYLPALASLSNNFNIADTFTAMRGVFGLSINSFGTAAYANQSYVDRMLEVLNTDDRDDICDDPHFENIATTPVCSVISGIDPAYIDADPIDHILANPNVRNNINEDTGAVIGNDGDSNVLKRWEMHCLENDPEYAEFCTTSVASDGLSIQDKNMMALYFIDRTIDEYLENGPVAAGPQTTTSNESTGAVVDGDIAWPMKKSLYDSRKNVWLKGHGVGSGTFTRPGGRTGRAIDLGANSLGVRIGEPVYAMLSGTVRRVGASHAPIITSQVPGGTVEIVYAHGSNLTVKRGDTINVGERVFGLDSKGNSTAPHLHMDMSFNDQQFCPQDLFIFMDENPGKLPDFASLVAKVRGKSASQGVCSRI